MSIGCPAGRCEPADRWGLSGRYRLDMPVIVVDTGPRQVSRAVEVAAPADEIFDLLADPHQHPEVDGSSTVRSAIKGSSRLRSGDRFSIGMKMFGLPYRITSRVTQAQQGRLLEWQHPLGHRWRWTFVPVDAGSGSDSDKAGTTRVTETFDYSMVGPIQAGSLELLRFPSRNAAGIEATLERLEARYRG